MSEGGYGRRETRFRAVYASVYRTGLCGSTSWLQ